MEIAIGLSFPGALQDEAIICRICKEFEIWVNIIEASFSMNAGWAILKVKGEEAEIKRTFEYLKTKGVRIEKMGLEK
jgi:ABC-type methionine transport system ATPase subunit